MNDFVAKNQIASVIDLGCGDGQNAALISVPGYLGLDISAHAIALAKQRCDGQQKRFAVLDERSGHPAERAELALSMDVVYHLIEDDVFNRYLKQLASLATRCVLIYGTDRPHERTARHVLHRPVAEHFTELNDGWQLQERVPNHELYGAQWRDHPHFIAFARSG